MDIGGAGQRGTAALLVRVDEVPIGPFVLERPWVMLVLDGNLGSEDEGALGAGALTGFDRVGIDRERRVLEMVPGDLGDPGAGGALGGRGLRAAAPGAFLGLRVVVPDAAARARGERLPVVSAVTVGTTAAAAGIVVGDRVVAIDGMACEGMAAGAIHETLWGSRARAVVVVEVRRADGKVERVSVRVGE